MSKLKQGSAERDSFIDELNTISKSGNATWDTMQRFKTISKTKAEGAYGEWVSWKRVCDDKGETVAAVWITGKNVRPWPMDGLETPNTLRYPATHEFAVIADKWSNVNEKKDTVSLKATTNIADRDPEVQEELTGMFEDMFKAEDDRLNNAMLAIDTDTKPAEASRGSSEPQESTKAPEPTKETIEVIYLF